MVFSAWCKSSVLQIFPVSKSVVFSVCSKSSVLQIFPYAKLWCFLCGANPLYFRYFVRKTVVFSVRSKRLSLGFLVSQTVVFSVRSKTLYLTYSVSKTVVLSVWSKVCRSDFPSANPQRSLRGVHLCASRYPFSRTVVFLKLVSTSKYAVSQNVVFLESVRTSKSPSAKLWSSLRVNKLQMTLLRSFVTTNL